MTENESLTKNRVEKLNLILCSAVLQLCAPIL